jgi:acyl-CoA thioester hydrolase
MEILNMTDSFTSVYKVTIGDINYGGHLGNDKALVIFQDARLHFLKTLEVSEIDIGEGCGIIMVESGVRYHREVFLHDELIISVEVSAVRGKKFTLSYTVIRKSDEAQVLSGFTSFLSFNYQSRKVATLPAPFQQQLETFLAA